MGIRLDNDGGYEDLKEHIGHKVVVAKYGATREPPVNIAIECETCNCVLLDFDAPEGSVVPEAKLRRCKSCGTLYDPEDAAGHMCQEMMNRDLELDLT